MFISAPDLLPRNPPARHHAVAVADLDGDGRFAVIVPGFGGPTRVLRRTGSALRDTAPTALADPDRPAVAVSAGDLDGDGREELYVVGVGHPDRLFDGGPDGRWDDLFARPENRPARSLGVGRGVAVVDRRGVGRYGFVVAGGRAVRLIERGPAGVLVDLAGAVGLGAVGCGRAVLPVPLFGDAVDVVCVNESGPNAVYRNTGGTFTDLAAAVGLTDPHEDGRGAAAVGGDGLSLCWGNADGPHRLMARRACGTYRDRASPALALPSAVRGVIAADFDNDGHDELFVHNHGEPNRLFRVTPDADVVMLECGAAVEADGYGTAAVAADVDGDGVLELLLVHGDGGPQPIGVYKARGAEANRWLRVRPLTRFGAPARGAMVWLEANGRRHVKVICGAGGEPVAHFGLGGDGRADAVMVAWPDGASVTLDDPGDGQTLAVPYPRG